MQKRKSHDLVKDTCALCSIAPGSENNLSNGVDVAETIIPINRSIIFIFTIDHLITYIHRWMTLSRTKCYHRPRGKVWSLTEI